MKEAEVASNNSKKPDPIQQDTQTAAIPKKRFSFKEKREFEQLGKDIEALGKEKEDIQEQLNSGQLPYDQLQGLASRIATITDLLDEKELRWLELSEYTD